MAASCENKNSQNDKRKLDSNELEKDEVAVKQAKLVEKDTGTHPQWESLENFRFVTVLKDDAQTKTVVFHAKTSQKKKEETNGVGVDGSGGEADAIIVMEKTPFDTTDQKMEKMMSGTAVTQLFNNDIYGTYDACPPKAANNVKTVVIFPATAKHFEKYTSRVMHLVHETPDDYQNIVLPYLEKSLFDMAWIYNILEKKKESEFIVYEDPDPINGYILLPDLKWDRKSTDNMYLSAIIHRRDVKSLRDLTTEHLPLLKNIQKSALKAIEEKYGVASTKVRAYFHYQPSYFHLHVHFNQIKYIAPGSNTVGAHLLSDVIDNIEINPEYYGKRTLCYALQDGALLYNCFKDAGRVGKIPE